jgi:hypothetical protein
MYGGDWHINHFAITIITIIIAVILCGLSGVLPRI